jgi:ankyrin repeat protein
MLAARAATIEPTITVTAAYQSDPWILRAVLDRGAPVDGAPRDWRRPIVVAVERDRWAHVALLLARGAAFDENRDGRSPLSVAAMLGNLHSVNVLVDHELATGGLQIITTPGPYRPHLTGMRRIDVALLETTDPAAIELLVRRGADPDLVARLRR